MEASLYSRGFEPLDDKRPVDTCFQEYGLDMKSSIRCHLGGEGNEDSLHILELRGIVPYEFPATLVGCLQLTKLHKPECRSHLVDAVVKTGAYNVVGVGSALEAIQCKGGHPRYDRTRSRYPASDSAGDNGPI